MIGVRLHPLDTWFFRNGVPFTRDSAPQENVASLFPPHPPTVVGALRAAIARANGWDGIGRWQRELDAVLGSGPDDLGKMSVDAPFLIRRGQPMFRAPRHLVGDTDGGRWRPRAFLRPGDPPVQSDLGFARLPEYARQLEDAHAFEAGKDIWLTAPGMSAALMGKRPKSGQIVPSGSLWTPEPRIGIERDHHTRAAVESMLYSAQHVRPSAGVSLGARIHGLPQDWNQPTDGMMLPLGGESRLASLDDRWDGDLKLSDSSRRVRRIRRDAKVALVALSPLDVDAETRAGHKPIDGLGARIVSACVDRPQRIGGWDSLDRGPLPIRSALPPGSVLFCELSDPERLDAARGGLARIGARTEWGFGLVALGIWPR